MSRLLIDIRRPGDLEAQGAAETLLEASPERLAEIGNAIADAGAALIRAIASSATKPRSCSIEFGIELEGQVGIPLITKGRAAANFNVTVVWTTEEAKV